jgi:hypothetical protein
MTDNHRTHGFLLSGEVGIVEDIFVATIIGVDWGTALGRIGIRHDVTKCSRATPVAAKGQSRD